MRLKTRTIAGGLVVVGVVLGTFMSGLLPGFGGGAGAQVSGIGGPAAFPDDDLNERESAPEHPPVVELPVVTIPLGPPPAVLEVKVDNHEYLIPDESIAAYRPATLNDIVQLALRTKGNDDGIRVRIVRSKSARLTAWSTLYDVLVEAGIPRDSIRMPKDLIN